MTRINPDDVERCFDQEAMKTSVLVGGNLTLPSLNFAQLRIETSKAFWLAGLRKVDTMASQGRMGRSEELKCCLVQALQAL